MMILEKMGIKNSGKSFKIYNLVLGESWGEIMQAPSEFIARSWRKFQESGKTSNNTNGTLFEYLLMVVLYKKDILPFYTQASLSFVPNAIFDIVLYPQTGLPITLSAKTSLRERYKQADLEGWALKNVHRKAKNYLVTLNENECERVKSKIEAGEIAGLDDVILANQMEFDGFIEKLTKMKFIGSRKVDVIKGNLIDLACDG